MRTTLLQASEGIIMHFYSPEPYPEPVHEYEYHSERAQRFLEYSGRIPDYYPGERLLYILAAQTQATLALAAAQNASNQATSPAPAATPEAGTSNGDGVTIS